MNAIQSKTVVVKVGGDVVLDPKLAETFSNNIAALQNAGARVVILHGGGPQVTALQKALGQTPLKVGGRRVTRPEDLVSVVSAICGEVNVNLSSALIQAGVNAFGMHGLSGQSVVAVKRPPRVVSGGGNEPIDFGEVGDVVRVQTRGMKALLDAGFVPVMATLGGSEKGERVFNINADTTAVSLAQAFKADWLLLVTQVGAIFGDLDDASTRVKEVSEKNAQALIGEGVIVGGMIPKVEEALRSLHEGVGRVGIVAPEAGAFEKMLTGSRDVGTVLSLE